MNTNDFASLLWILKMSRQNGAVYVELPKAEGTEMREMWRAHLHLVEGHVAACHVFSLVDERKLLSDDEALRWLAGWGQRELAWSQEVFTQHKTAPRPAPADPLPPPRHVAPAQRVSQPADLPTPARYGSPPHHVAQPEGLLQLARQNTPPQRIVQAEQSLISSWPRKHRQVFALVDGKRSVRHIATILKLSPADVEVVVNELQSLGVIRK